MFSSYRAEMHHQQKNMGGWSNKCEIKWSVLKWKFTFLVNVLLTNSVSFLKKKIFPTVLCFLTSIREARWHEESRLKADMLSNSAGSGNKDHITHCILWARECSSRAYSSCWNRQPYLKGEKKRYRRTIVEYRGFSASEKSNWFY